MVESLAVAGVVAVAGTLWKLSLAHASLRVSLDTGIKEVVNQLIALRVELGKDITRLDDVIERIDSVIEDHEFRIRKLEQE